MPAGHGLKSTLRIDVAKSQVATDCKATGGSSSTPSTSSSSTTQSNSPNNSNLNSNNNNPGYKKNKRSLA